MDIDRVPELLCPAGDLERLQSALFYGADAIYLSGSSFNLRAKSRGFDLEQLSSAVSLARGSGARIYFCLNALATENDLEPVRKYLDILSGLEFDAFIVSDPGLIRMVRTAFPDKALHLSTQAGTYNSQAALFWSEQGVDRVNLARELSLKEIRLLSRSTEKKPELEIFVHGAMCMAVSGFCLLSAHLNKRSANQGSCTHPCRFDYRPRAMALEERTRPGRITWQVWEEDDYSSILSSEDLCLVKYLPWMIRNRIDCLKVEGRMKSAGYLGIVTDVYRTALNDINKKMFRPDLYLKELALAGSRPLSSGFFLPERKIFVRPEDKRKNKAILARVVRMLEPSTWLVQVKSLWNTDRDVELVLPGLRRPVLSYNEYCLETADITPLSVAHSGQTAVLRTDDARVVPHMLIRSA